MDDYVVEEIEGLTRSLHAVRKHPDNPVLRPERSREGTAIEYTTVIWDPAENLFKAWYVVGDNQDARSSPGAKSRYTVQSCYATSPNGIHWDNLIWG